MRPIQTFSVIPSLPPAIEGLRGIAYNLRWSWDHATIELFRRLDRDLWESSGHNPVSMLGSIEQSKLEDAAGDDAFVAHLRHVESDLENYMSTEPRWFDHLCKAVTDRPRVAYFSAEFGLTECLSIFAGGLGILAGDHLKSASDLGLPLTGIGLLYQQGYFRQALNQAGWQEEVCADNDFHNLPLSPASGPDGSLLIVSVRLLDRDVFAQVWRVQVGRIALYLLDTNIARNVQLADRDITDHLYGGDREIRIRQEILLGIGGYRALMALGLEPTVFHMNEGHSAFLALEHVRHLMGSRGLSFDEARELASASLVFTTHTPVEAGHDYFSEELVQRYFGAYLQSLGLTMPQFMALGRIRPDQEFCMTVLALRLASRCNGVSKLHGEVSRRVWQPLWPGVPLDEIPIRHVTNGVHFRSWMSLEMNQLYDRYLGPQWREEPVNGSVWKRVESIPAEELWRTHEQRRVHLVTWARRRVRQQRIRRGAPPSEIAAADEILDPDALTIGFARRFATYKRATLILRDMERLKRMLHSADRPVQIIFSGKAHPRDEAGKELIRQISTVTRDPELGRRVVFLTDYDMAVARYLVEGVDVWLNTPLRPYEASGTSGMKAAANGVLNLSVPDGWWDEVWNNPANSQLIGWSIGLGENYQDQEYQNELESKALYELLESDVIPAFYDRGSDRVPRQWIERMKASISTLCPFVNTHRMVSEYMCHYYTEAHSHYRTLNEGGAARARALSAWMARVREQWPRVRITSVERQAGGTLPVGTSLRVRARVELGELLTDDVRVELYIGRLDSSGEIVAPSAVEMQTPGKQAGNYLYEAVTGCAHSGLHGFTVRVLPSHPDLFVPFIPGLIDWATSDAASAS